MDVVSIFLVAGCVMIVALVALKASKRSLFKHLSVYLSAAIAFIVTLVLLKSGALDLSVETLSSIAGNLGRFGEVVDSSAAVRSAMGLIVNYVIRIMVFTVLFWVLYCVVRLLVRALAKLSGLSKREFYNKNTGAVSTVATATVNVLLAYFMLIVTFFPILSLCNSLSSARIKAKEVDNEGTFTYDAVLSIEENLPFLSQESLFARGLKYSGGEVVVAALSNALGEGTVTNNRGESFECNVNSFLSDIAVGGVDATNLYEKYLAEEVVYGEFAEAGEVAVVVSKSKIILTVACDLLSDGGVFADYDGEFKPFVDLLQDEYSSVGEEERLSEDIIAIKRALDNFIDVNKNETFNSEEIVGEVVRFLSEKENAKTEVEELSKLSLYNELTVKVSEFGLEKLCEAMNIPSDKNGLYEDYVTALVGVLNDRETGRVNFTLLDEFLKYVTEEDVTIAQYKEDNYDSENGDDAAWVNYDRYMRKVTEISNVVSDYTVFCDGTTCVPAGGVLYVYGEDSDKWSVVDMAGQAALKSDGLLTHTLVALADEYGDSESGIDKNTLIERLNDMSADGFLTDGKFAPELIACARKVLDGILDVSALESDRILVEDVMAKINRDCAADGEDNAAVGEIVRIACGIYGLILDGDGEVKTSDIVLGNFGKIGEVLDALNKFSVTENVSEITLRAVAQSSEYKKYIDAESAENIISNIKEGKSTYAELLTSVQSLYKIASSITAEGGIV